jgi:hypothetical protein
VLLKIIGGPVEYEGHDRVANFIGEAAAIFLNFRQAFCAIRHAGGSKTAGHPKLLARSCMVTGHHLICETAAPLHLDRHIDCAARHEGRPDQREPEEQRFAFHACFFVRHGAVLI